MYERLLNVRGLMIKDTTELVALTSLSSVYYLLLTCDYDILVSDKNWSVFVDYVRKCSIEVNSGCELDPYPHDAHLHVTLRQSSEPRLNTRSTRNACIPIQTIRDKRPNNIPERYSTIQPLCQRDPS